MTKMIPLDEAVRQVLERAAGRKTGAEELPLAEALNRTLAEDVISTQDVPAFANSAMDGYAVRAPDTEAVTEEDVALRVIGESRAGDPATVALEPGTAVAISTGAMIPEGADAVVRVEDTETSASGRQTVIRVPAHAGLNVRMPGEDVKKGDRVLEAGMVLGPAELGVLASIGLAGARCARSPRVAVVVTGDELVQPGKPIGPGQIVNTNGITIPALARRAGAEIVANKAVPDEYQATVGAIREGMGADILTVCGGVSVGKHDHVKNAFRELGIEEHFWRAAIRPGKPIWFGSTRETLVFGLPGNPVSAMVTFHLFVRPALAAMQGRLQPEVHTEAILDTGVTKKRGLTYAIRCRLHLAEDGWHISPTKDQGSHVLTSMLGAEVLALLDADRSEIHAGDRVRISPI